jgi:hypothetical protein
VRGEVYRHQTVADGGTAETGDHVEVEGSRRIWSLCLSRVSCSMRLEA